MTRFLDARTSQNSSGSFFMSVPIEQETPVLIGQVGLSCVNPDGIIRVQFTATATLVIPAETTVAAEIFIVRGTAPTDPQVYSGIFAERGNPFPVTRIVTVTGSDYDVPAPPSNLLIYTAFFRGEFDIEFPPPTRIGPESLNASAYCD